MLTKASKANITVVTPQHPPKHLTDEELKQQYGIHLATRIQADGDAKEAKWADIDDDEDDWAPDTIEWNDGTKINISQQESASLLAAKRAEEEVAKKREEEEKKAKAAKAAAEKKPTSSVGPNATVLKPRSAQAKPGSPLVLKTPTEKPTLVSKPTSSTPAKSPWAPLPAIDKVPPIEINPPVQQPGLRPQINGVQSQASIQIAPTPALEIAADSFKRGGVEFQKDTVGQLYNDKSGKYEPASAGRRGSMRKDGGYRAPSLLQRGGPIPDASAILGANREAFDEDAGAEVGAQDRRLSGNKGSDFGGDRHGSQPSQDMQSPQMLGLGFASPDATQTAYKAGSGSNNAVSSGDRDDVAIQKQLMREKREEAIKRRKEQAEREEAEKQERIRKKLASLGPEPSIEKKDTVKQEVPAVTIEKRPSDVDDVHLGKTEARDTVPTSIDDISPSLESPSKFTRSPPKPPAPSATGEPQQYGMMKVHAPVPRDPIQQVNETLAAERARNQGLGAKSGRNIQDVQFSAQRTSEMQAASRKLAASLQEHQDRLEPEAMRKASSTVLSPPGFETKSQENLDRTSPLVNGNLTPSKHDTLFSISPEMVGQRSIGDSKQQPWNDSSREPKLFSTWNQPFMKDAHSSVWGAPSQSRVLNNGIFDRAIQRPHSRPQDQYPTPTLAPIGPPKHLQQPKDHRESRSLHDASPIENLEDTQTIPSFPLSDHIAANRRGMQAHMASEQKLPSPQFSTGAQHEPDRTDSRPHYQDRERGTGAWQEFTRNVAQKETEELRQAQVERENRKAEEARSGVSYRPQIQFQEKWAQIEVDEHGPGRRVSNVVRSLNTPGLSNILQSSDIRGPSFVNASDVSTPMPGTIGRSSRFFPTVARLHPYQQSPAPFTPYHRQSDSPPPPDSMYHPAFTPQARGPVVRLPSFNSAEETTKPKVKLPPANATPVQTPRPSPAQLSLRPTQQPLVNNQAWQERFNGLLGTKKATSDKSPEMATARVVDFSATKEPLDLPTPRLQAAVTLPPRDSLTDVGSLNVASQDYQDEEALFEPEAGSVPEARIPQKATSRVWQAPPLKRDQVKSLIPSIEIMVTSKDMVALPYFPGPQDNTLLVFIKVAGMTNSVSKPMRAPTGHSVEKGSPAQHPSSNRQGNSSTSKHPNRVFKHRDSSKSWHNPSNSGSLTQHKAAGGTQRNNFHRPSQGTPQQQHNAAPPKQPRSKQGIAAT